MHVKTNGDVIEKPALSSKKFLAFMWSMPVWILIIGGTLLVTVYVPDMRVTLGTVLLAEVLCVGFVQAGYILGQAGVDAFVRMATIIVNGKNSKYIFSEGESDEDLSDDPTEEEDPPEIQSSNFEEQPPPT